MNQGDVYIYHTAKVPCDCSSVETVKVDPKLIPRAFPGNVKQYPYIISTLKTFYNLKAIDLHA